MIWIVLVLGLLFVAMSCVALWYRRQWDKAVGNYRGMCDMFYEMKEKYDELKYDNACTLQEIGALNIEIGILRSKLPKRDSKGRYCKKGTYIADYTRYEEGRICIY